MVRRPAVDHVARPVLRVGLTGGIASGKTTVAGFLAAHGALVLDADRIVHDMLAPGGAAVERVAGRFGREILDPQGGIDRRALGSRVFADGEARAALNAIVHPGVRRELDRRIAEFQQAAEGGSIAVVDAALLVETGRHRDFDRVVVVSCRRETQLRRLQQRDGLSREQAEARVDAQAPLEDKVAVADYVIDTESSIEDTRRRTSEVYAALVDDLARLHGTDG